MTAYRIGQSALPGTSYPLGATVRADGTNFAVTSSAADSMKLCLFDAALLRHALLIRRQLRSVFMTRAAGHRIPQRASS